MTSYIGSLNNLLSTTTSRYNSLRRNLLSNSSEDDTVLLLLFLFPLPLPPHPSLVSNPIIRMSTTQTPRMSPASSAPTTQKSTFPSPVGSLQTPTSPLQLPAPNPTYPHALSALSAPPPPIPPTPPHPTTRLHPQTPTPHAAAGWATYGAINPQ